MLIRFKAASSVDFFTLDLAAGNINNPTTDRVPPNISYQALTVNIQTLWGNNEQGDDIEGLLYVPDLNPSSTASCDAGIPANVTRRRNLPQANYPTVAVAPWISMDCVRQYLMASQNGINAFVFYLPDNDADTPPPITSPVWGFDGSGSWNGLNNFPIYAIPGAVGSVLMQELALYSGPASSAPNASALLSQAGPTDFIRLYANFATAGGAHYPTLWAFLLIILGIVLVLLAVTSVTMRLRQRRNRNNLRQRVLAGEVDLETLGVRKPPRMSQSDVDALQMVTYVPSEQKSPLPLPESSAKGPPSHEYNQTTCPICLEDYIANETNVRVLPCHHIYHPECIDPHLLSSSSLCPVCKAKVPTVAEAAAKNTDTNRVEIPEITNAMVRRERYMRNVRERGARTNEVLSPAEWFQRRFGRPLMPTVGIRAAERRRARFNRDRMVSVPVTATPNAMEMGEVSHPESIPLPPSPSPSPSPSRAPQIQLPADPPQRPQPPTRRPSNTEARQEWSRRRASALLHRHSRADGQPSVATIEEEERDTPGWRRGLRSVFPGFR